MKYVQRSGRLLWGSKEGSNLIRNFVTNLLVGFLLFRSLRAANTCIFTERKGTRRVLSEENLDNTEACIRACARKKLLPEYGFVTGILSSV
jgi:hypothetical protein